MGLCEFEKVCCGAYDMGISRIVLPVLYTCQENLGAS